MTFQTFLKTKYPLYSDPKMKVNLTFQQVEELVEEWENTVSANNDKEISFASLKGFFDWKETLRFEMRGGVKMYDVEGWYKWLDEDELFDYYDTRFN